MAELSLNGEVLEQAAKKYEKLAGMAGEAEEKFASLAAQVDSLSSAFGSGLLAQENFASGIEDIESGLTSFIKDSLGERLTFLNGYVSKGLDLQNMMAGGIEEAESYVNGFVQEKLGERFGFLENYMSGGLDLQNMMTGGIEEAEGYINDFLREKFGEKYEMMSGYYSKGMEIAGSLYDGWVNAEDNITKFMEASTEERLGMVTGMFDTVSGMLGDAAKENKAAAVAQKAMASAQAVIDTYLGATKALGSAPPPFNYVLMAGVIATGLANVAKINSIPIPSAETGGRFVVPDVYPVNHVDSALMRVNPGEEVNVTPKGGVAENAHYTFKINEQVIFDIVTRGIRSGDILIEPAANL
ncbi:MAG: hypothetical protein FWH38_05230 [Treponema sp.]|nr:hypothetical protein [Treponema sp.]